jgi:hypothetical protein
MTYLWQEERGQKYYRVQTDNKQIYKKMKRSEKYKLLTLYCSRDLWVFLHEFDRPDIAKKVVSSLTGIKPQIDSDGVIFYDPSYSVVYKKTKAPKGKNGSEPTLFR